MKSSILSVAAAALWLVACHQGNPPTASEPAVPAAATSSRCGVKVRPTSVLAVPPKEMRRALADAYRLKPDRRFLLAIGDIHHFFVPDVPAQPADAGFADGKWRICYGDQTVGQLPELAGFGDWLGLLSTWAVELNRRYPVTLKSTVKAEDPEVEERLRRFAVSDALYVVRHVGKKWKQGQRTGAGLFAVARALTIVSLQKLDRMEIGDAVEGRTIAALALVKSLTDYDIRRQEALLAQVLWHVNYAASVARELAPNDPIRLFIVEDDEHLKEVARSKNGTVEARYLYLLRLADLKDKEDLGYWQRAFFPNPLSLPVLKAAMELRDFDVSGSLARTLPYVVAATAAVEAGSSSLIDLTSLFKKGAERDTLRVSSRVKQMLRLDTQSLSTRLESDLTTIGRDTDGVFMDSETTKAYYRAYFYSGLYVAGLHYLDALSSIDAVRYFREVLGQPETVIAADFVRWYGDLGQSKEGRSDPSRLKNDLTALRTLGTPPLERTFDELAQTLSYGNPWLFASARSLAARMDDRILHRNTLAGIAYSRLYDLHLAEHLYRTSIDATRDPYLIAWYARFTGDEKSLVRVLRSPGLEIGSRIQAVEYLRALGAPDSRVDAAYRTLLGQQPDRWDISKAYLEFLEAGARYRQAEEVAEHWLNRHGPRHGFPYVFATTALARQYYHEGRYEDGLKVIEPVVATQQAGAMERYALLLAKAGRHEQAEKWGHAVVARYPDSVRSRGRLAGIYWQDGKYKEVAWLIEKSPSRISSLDWREKIGRVFAEVFADEPAEGLKAFDALLAGNLSHFNLQQMVWPVNERGQHALAFKMAAKLHGKGLSEVEFLVRAYKPLKAWRGEQEALAWLRARIPAPALNPSSMIVYGESEFDLLWDLIRRPQDGQHSNAVWLYRAAASIRRDGESASHRRALEKHFEASHGSFYHVLGRYLLGYATAEEVMPLVTDKNKRCEAAYYLGLRAMHEGRFNDASDWFRIAVETGQIRMGEYRWAYNELLHLVNRDLSLTVLASRYRVDKIGGPTGRARAARTN